MLLALKAGKLLVWRGICDVSHRRCEDEPVALRTPWSESLLRNLQEDPEFINVMDYPLHQDCGKLADIFKLDYEAVQGFPSLRESENPKGGRTILTPFEHCPGLVSRYKLHFCNGTESGDIMSFN